MIDKAKVERNFSRGAATYDQSAGMHRRFAAELAGRVAKLPTRPNRILEVGCGTGIMSGKLLRLFPDASFVFNDISAPMLEACRSRLEPMPEFDPSLCKFAEADAESAEFGRFDLVATTFALQWFQNIPAAVRHLAGQLNPDGALAFSTLGSDSFSSLRCFFERAGFAFPGPPLPSPQDIRAAMTVFDELDLRVESYQEHPTSWMDILRSFKTLGAGNPGHALGAAALRKVLRKADVSGETPTAEHEILWGMSWGARRCQHTKSSLTEALRHRD